MTPSEHEMHVEHEMALEVTPRGGQGAGGRYVPDAAKFPELALAALNASEMLRGGVAAAATTEAVLRDGAALLAALPEYASACGSTLGAVWQELLRGAPGGSISGNAAMPRTPPRGSACGVQASSSQRWQALVVFEGSEARILERCASAAALRSQLRLSLCDDADLALARQVVGECSGFFERLRVHAAESGLTPAEAWARLLS